MCIVYTLTFYFLMTAQMKPYYTYVPIISKEVKILWATLLLGLQGNNLYVIYTWLMKCWEGVHGWSLEEGNTHPLCLDIITKFNKRAKLPNIAVQL